MNLRSWIIMIIILVDLSTARNFYFYADLRFDQYNYFKNVVWDNEVPYNHGLRMITAISLAKDKVMNGLRIWSQSPMIVNGTVKNQFYQSNAEYVAVCKGIDGSDSPSDCLLNSNYDVGFCSPKLLEPVKDSSAFSGLHCKNNPPQGHVFPFKAKDDLQSSSIPLLKEGESIKIILPDGTGLDGENLELYLKKFQGVARARSISLGALNDRVKFLADMFGQDFAGIIGSTDNAYYTAIIAKNLGVPNIVPLVIEKEGIWPQSSSENFSPGTMDSTLVLGHEDWVIVDQLAYIITKTGWGSGAMSILAESGYSELWARNIKNNIGAELSKRNEGYIRAGEDIMLQITTVKDLYKIKDERNEMSFRNKFLRADKSSNFFVVIGKELFLRHVLEWFKLYKKYKSTVHVFGVVLIPESGSPCPDFIWSTRSAKKSNKFMGRLSDVAVESVLEGVFSICHNSHNRGPWKWKKSDKMSPDGSNGEDKTRWKFDPPSLNTETKYDPEIGQDSYDLNRQYRVADEELDLSKWNRFEASWLTLFNWMFSYTRNAARSLRVKREDFRATSIASFAHDALIWGMFTAVLNRTYPELFVSETGEYTLMNLFGDGTTHRDTNNNPRADMTRIGWPGMFGYETPNVNHYNETHWKQKWDILINDGPWHDFVNRYTFKDNRPFGAVPWTIKMYSQGKWHRYAGLLPHRRKAERDGLPYERTAESLATSPKTDLNNNPITTGVPIYDNYKFIRYYQNEYDFADTSEPACTYDSLHCAIMRFAQSFVPVAIILLILFSIPLADKLYFGRKRRKFEIDCNKMYWRLDPETEEITFKAPGQGVRSSMMMSTAGGGTNFGGTTFGGGTTAGGGTTFGGNTTVGGTSAGIETTGLGSVLTGTRAMSSLGISSSSGNSKGGKQQVFTDIAIYKNKRWALKPLEEIANGMIKDPSKDLKIEMKRMYDELVHSNVIRFGGLVCTPNIDRSLFFTEYCSKGSLQDVLEDTATNLDFNFRLSFVVDIINGMDYLHNFTHMRSHGYLKSSNVLITGSFTAKIADFGTLMRTNDIQKVGNLEYIGRQIRTVWTAPEILRNTETVKELKGTREGDVYSFGIICHEIIDCSGPFNSHDDFGLGADEIVQNVISRKHKKPFRPAFSGIKSNDREIFVMNMARECWAENPHDRPTFEHLRMACVPKIEDGSMTLGQCILQQFKQMVEDKEKEIRTFDVNIRSKKAIFSEMQRQLLPQDVLNKLVVGQPPEPTQLISTSVLSLEITGVSGMISKGGDDFWTSIEQIRESVIGLSRDHSDLFCVVASATQFTILANGSMGCPESQTTDLLKLCRDVQNFIELLESPGFKLNIRAGIDSGSSYVGLVGAKFRSFQLYGETCRNAYTLRESAADGMCYVTGDALKMLGDKANEFENVRSIKSIPNVKVFATQLSSIPGESGNQGDESES